MAKPRREDPKQKALRAHGTLHARSEAVTDPLFHADGFFDPRDLLQVKYEMLRRVRIDGAPILPTSGAFGLSRPTFYQAQAAFDLAGLFGLLPAKRGPRHAHKLSAEVMAFVDSELRKAPSLRPAELASRIRVRFKLRVHPRSVERAQARSKKA
jgi:transposase